MGVSTAAGDREHHDGVPRNVHRSRSASENQQPHLRGVMIKLRTSNLQPGSPPQPHRSNGMLNIAGLMAGFLEQLDPVTALEQPHGDL